MAVASSLKTQNQPALIAALILNAGAFAALIGANSLLFPGLTADLSALLKPAVPAGAIFVLCGVLNHQLDQKNKARLVFWRWRDPLPGSQAFSKLGPGDPRITMSLIEARLGRVPVTASEQNAAWYRLYRQVDGDPAVETAHKAFLLYRDYASLSFLCLITMAPVALLLAKPIATAAIYGGALGLQYLLARNAAADRGRRFVCNVLAAHMGFAGETSTAPLPLQA
jgi:hypothetical protein